MFVGKGNSLYDFLLGLNESGMLKEVCHYIQLITKYPEQLYITTAFLVYQIFRYIKYIR